MNTRRKRSKLRKSLPFEYVILTLIVALGLVLRVYHLQFYLENGGLDSMWYTHAGVQYSYGNWLTRGVTFKGPLLTLLLGLSIQIFGPTFIVTKFVSLVAGSLLPIIVFFLGSELFGKKIGFLSALIVSINPLLIFYHGLVYREILFSFAWTASIYFALRGFKGNFLYSIIGGVFFALSSLTIELGIFAGIGFFLFFLLEKVKRSKKKRRIEYQNLDIFFLGAILTLAPFIVKNYLTYKEPFIQWAESLDFLKAFLPFSVSALMLMYVGLMALSVPYVIVFRVSRFNSGFPRKLDHLLFSSIRHHSKAIKIYLAAFLLLLVVSVTTYEFYNGPSHMTRILLGIVKLSGSLAFPEALGFLLIFSIAVMIYTLRSSNDVVLIISIFVFSTIGIIWGITTHYLTTAGLEYNEILFYSPWGPLDNAFRYVTSYIPLLAIFASYGIFLLAEKSTHKLLGSTKKKAKKARRVKTVLLCALISAVLFQFVYADAILRVKAQRDTDSLQKRYELVVNWFSGHGSPVIYGFNPMLKEVYGEEKVVLLTDESLMEIAQRASKEKIEFIVSDIFGPYSEAQLALYFGGMNEDPSYVRLNRFSLTKSYKGWPSVQIFAISEVESNQTSLVVQHENWGQEWVSFLSESHLVDTVDEEEDLITHFSGDHKLIVLTEIKRTLTDAELNILRQKVASGVILIVNGLSPAYLNLETNGYWIGASNFVEAPKDAKWNIKFTESATSITTEIDIDDSYAFYTSSPYSSPTGLTGIEDDVVIYATRVEDAAAAIYAKPYVNGVVVFSGVRPSYATAAEHYDTYINFLESLLEEANDKTLFP